MEKIKIAVLGAKGFPAWGGAASSNEAIFNRLNDKYEITIYAVSSHTHEKEYHGMRQIIFQAYKNKKISIIAYYVKSFLHAFFVGKYDVVHINHGVSGVIVPFLRIRYPVVFNLHGFDHIEDNKWRPYEIYLAILFMKIGVFFSSITTTVQKCRKEKIERLKPNKIIYIPNGVENYIKNINKYNIIYDLVFAAANINYIKGLHLLLKALRDLNFNGKVIVIGDLDQVADYKNEIKKLAAGLNCHFAGLIKNKAELLAKIMQSKIFIFPSYTEGMSNMLLEVASLKVPVIASNINQNTDIFSEEEMVFFRSGDANDLRNAIEKSLNNYDELILKAESAYSRVIKDHNWDHIALRYDAIYCDLLHR